MRIIVLINQNLSLTNLKNFELNYKNRKINFEFWSFTSLFEKEIFKKFSGKNYRNITHSKYKQIKSFRHLNNLINKIKKKTIVMNLSGTLTSLIVELFMIYKGCEKITRFDNYNIKEKKCESLSEDFNNIVKFGYKFLIKKIFFKFKKSLESLIRKTLTTDPKYYFVPNQRSYDIVKTFNSNAKIKKYNSSAFNQFKKLKLLRSKKNFIVYIDQEFERSFESIVLKNDHQVIDKEKYWNCLDSIFKKLEKKLKLKIKIAAHFRRGQNNIPNINREFFYDQTPELIKNSKLVIGHNSLALHYAILFKKPIILLNFEVFDSISLVNGKEIKKFNQETNSKTIYIDNSYEFEIKQKLFKNIFDVNKEKYKRFQNYYINFKSNKDVSQNLWISIFKRKIN